MQNKTKSSYKQQKILQCNTLIVIIIKINPFHQPEMTDENLFEMILESKILFLKSGFNQRFIEAIQMFICLCALHMIVFNFIILEHFQFSNVLIIGSLQHNCRHKSNLFSQHGIFLFYHYLYFFR